MQEMVQFAAKVAACAGCSKSKRGVVLFRGAEVLAVGANSPPKGFSCDGSPACQRGCGKVAVHAEQRAILAAGASRMDIVGAEMLHVKVVPIEGGWEPVASGGPSCPDCSKLILEAGIAGMWLLEERDGKPTLIRYTADEFHAATLANLGLSPGR